MNIGERLKAERERLKLSQTAFGEIGGMGKTTVISWERGSAYPNAAFLEAAAQFGVDVSYVITGMRIENVASTPMELAYLRNCRALPTPEARQAGLNGLVALREAYGAKLNEGDGK
ncbi:helix-turn-helix domain-containing protein [Ralstonia syzygii subsp. celebesensis]|uniref:helix-turn-helix domain-containing protein n=1 Tax=Ralstonia syzygii TaxID=28097 RepID=UPI00387E17C0